MGVNVPGLLSTAFLASAPAVRGAGHAVEPLISGMTIAGCVLLLMLLAVYALQQLLLLTVHGTGKRACAV
jgi:hypothetical protein